MMNKLQYRLVVRLLADYLKRAERSWIGMPEMREGGAIGTLDFGNTGIVIKCLSSSNVLDFNSMAGVATCSQLYSLLLGAFSQNFPAEDLESSVQSLIKGHQIRVLGDAYIKGEVPCRVRAHPSYGGKPWTQDMVWYALNGQEKTLGHVQGHTRVFVGSLVAPATHLI